MSNQAKNTCRHCYHEAIYQGRFFALQEVIAPVSIDSIMSDGFFNGWHIEAAGTPRLRQGDRMKVYQGSGVIAETLKDFTINAEAEFVVLSSEINNVRVTIVTDWLYYEDQGQDADVSIKWNPGKKEHQVIVNGDVVSGHASKEAAEQAMSLSTHKQAA